MLFSKVFNLLHFKNKNVYELDLNDFILSVFNITALNRRDSYLSIHSHDGPNEMKLRNAFCLILTFLGDYNRQIFLLCKDTTVIFLVENFTIFTKILVCKIFAITISIKVYEKPFATLIVTVAHNARITLYYNVLDECFTKVSVIQ